MQKAFARQTKLNNVVGRSNYISNESRQEYLIFHSEENLLNSWEEVANYEIKNQKSNVENNQAREIIIALPHELSNDLVQTKKIIDEYSKSLFGENRDFEYAVHWNKAKTNYHAHIIFCERERITERTEKTYKRDMWYDIESNKMAKVNANGAELRFRKGQVMVDKEGNIRYDDDFFTKKDSWFKTREFNEQIKTVLKDTLNKYDFQYRLFDKEIEVAEVHVGHEKKYAKNPQLYEKRISHNQNVSILNAFLKNYKIKIKEYLKKIKYIFNHNKTEYQSERLQILLTDPKEQESVQRQISTQIEDAELEAERIVAEEIKDLIEIDRPFYELKELINLVFLEDMTFEELGMNHMNKKDLLEAFTDELDSYDKKLDKLESLKDVFEDYQKGIDLKYNGNNSKSVEGKSQFKNELNEEALKFLKSKNGIKFLDKEYGIYSAEKLEERRTGMAKNRNEYMGLFVQVMERQRKKEKQKDKRRSRGSHSR